MNIAAHRADSLLLRLLALTELSKDRVLSDHANAVVLESRLYLRHTKEAGDAQLAARVLKSQVIAGHLDKAVLSVSAILDMTVEAGLTMDGIHAVLDGILYQIGLMAPGEVLQDCDMLKPLRLQEQFEGTETCADYNNVDTDVLTKAEEMELLSADITKADDLMTAEDIMDATEAARLRMAEAELEFD